MEESINIKKESYVIDMLKKFKQFRQEKKYCDFIINIEDIQIPVHKFVIAANSEYFDAMLSHDTKEALEGVVDVKDADPDCVEKCVDFMYTGDVSVAQEKWRGLMQMAQIFQLQRLYDGVVYHIGTLLSVETIFEAMETASFFGCQKLNKLCYDFVLDNFHIIMKNPEFVRIEADLLCELVTSKDSIVLDGVRLKAIVNWVGYDSTRSDVLLRLLQSINLEYVPLCYRKFILDNESVISMSPECFDYISKSVPKDCEERGEDYPMDFSPKIITYDKFVHSIMMYDLEKASFTRTSPLPHRIKPKLNSIALLGPYIFVITWNNSMLRLKIIEQNAEWEEMERPHDTCEGPLVALNGDIYAKYISSCNQDFIRYSVKENRWHKLPCKQFDFERSAITVGDGKLFVIGGFSFDTSAACSEVEYFDPKSLTWSTAPSLVVERYDCSACALFNAIYCFTGTTTDVSEPLTSAEILKSNSNVWELFRLPTPGLVSHVASMSLCGKIYLVDSSPAFKNTVKEYNPKEGTLTEVGSMQNSVSFGLTGIVM